MSDISLNHINDQMDEFHSDSIRKFNAEGTSVDKHFFFISAMPRSGTQWFAKFFTSNEVFCFHELTLICHENLESHYKAMTDFPKIKDTTLELSLHRLFYLYPSFIRRMYHKLYSAKEYVACGNSDCAQRYFLPALDHIFPKAKFLTILRNGFDVALSLEKKMQEPGTEKNVEYHKNSIFKNYGYKCNSLFEVACWRWRRGTAILLDYADKITPEKNLFVNFEKVFSDINLLKDICDFLTDNKAPFDSERAVKLLNTTINLGDHKKPKGKTIRDRWENLSNEKKELFLVIAGDFIRSLKTYEGWPDLDF